MLRLLAEIMATWARRHSAWTAERALSDLQRDWENAGDAARPFMDFIPIRLVTILETSVRDVVARAVDSGEPFASRGLSLIAKFPTKSIVDSLPAIKEDRITLGALVSHAFSAGRMDEVFGSLRIVFGETIRDELASVRTLWSEDEGKNLPPIIANISLTVSCLDRLLQSRHTMIHETFSNKPYSAEDVPFFFLHTERFTSALNWMLIGKIYGKVPMTQAGMNVQARQEMYETQAELDALRGGTADAFADPKAPNEEMEHYWDRFSQLSARIRAGYTSDGFPGTIAPFLYALEMTRLARWRIGEIMREKSKPEGML